MCLDRNCLFHPKAMPLKCCVGSPINYPVGEQERWHQELYGHCLSPDIASPVPTILFAVSAEVRSDYASVGCGVGPGIHHGERGEGIHPSPAPTLTRGTRNSMLDCQVELKNAYFPVLARSDLSPALPWLRTMSTWRRLRPSDTCRANISQPSFDNWTQRHSRHLEENAGHEGPTRL